MDSFIIHGGNRLKGKIEISGSKNSALPILAACLMAEGKTVLKGVPRLSDLDSMAKLIGELGCHVFRHESNATVGDGPALNGNLDLEVTDESMCEARYDIVKTMRASICVLGPLLAKRARRSFPSPEDAPSAIARSICTFAVCRSSARSSALRTATLSAKCAAA